MRWAARCCKDLAQLANLFHFLGGEIAHRRAAIGCAHDDAHAFEIGKSLAHDVTLGAEALHQRVFDQTLARAQSSKQNVEFKRTDDISCRAVAAISLRLFFRPLSGIPTLDS